MPELEAGSPAWWLESLTKELDERRSRIAVYNDYYIGRHPLAFASDKFRKAFGGLFQEFSDNWCELVVDAVEERLNVEGFRLGQEQKGDEAAWAIWQRNQLDADSQLGHTEALVNGLSCALSWYDAAKPKLAAITVEHPSQMIVRHAAGNRRQRLAALKLWTDDDDHEYATLYLPGGLYKWRSRKPVKEHTGSRRDWVEREVAGETWPAKNPLGLVPVVELANRPRLLEAGVSEIHQVIPQQDAVNKLVADMLIASEYAAFRQRWATGIDLPVDPETKKPIEPFKTAVDRLWVSKAQDARFGEFSETDLANYVRAIENRIQSIASRTRTPPHYFYLSGQFPSGESIKSAETGLVAKVRRKQRHFGEAWEEAIRIAFLVEGQAEKAAVTDSETIWGDPESRSEGEHVDATLKLSALGIPNEILWERAGFSPQQIARIKAIAAQAALEAEATAIAALGRFDADVAAGAGAGNGRPTAVPA